MHEKILQGVTIGIVAGLAVYWLTSRKHEGFQNSMPQDYKPIYGDVRAIRNGTPTCASCQCCGLPTGQTCSIPLASDYLCCAPDYAPTVSDFNLGVSIQVSCAGIELDSKIYRQETATSFPYGVKGPNSVPRPVRIAGTLSCSPNIPVQVDCTEVV
jgi:hypothetical protein